MIVEGNYARTMRNSLCSAILLFSSFARLAALCNEDANGNVPLGKSCNRYWNCQGGYPRLQRCPAMLVFDRHSLRCVVPPTDECEAFPPTPQQEDQPDGDQAERGQVN
jgi:Chitin binding Peritrophin-A domain